jgi:anti-sigma factor RsiW
MKTDLQLKIQAQLDGELPPEEAREVAGWLAQDAAARALLGELQNTSQALAGFEAEIKLPESREFYWSKIQREIHRLESAQAVAVAPGWLAGWRRYLMPVSALALAVLAAVILAPQLGLGRQTGEAEFALTDDGSSFTYRDYASGTTLVWLPYAAENDLAEFNMQDTLQ